MIKKFYKACYAVIIVSTLIIALVGCSSFDSSKDDEDSVDGKRELVKENMFTGENIITVDEAQRILDTEQENIGQNYEYIRNLIGLPYVRTYYVNKKDLGEGFIISNMPNEIIYPIESSEESSSLYLFFEGNKVVDMKIDEFSGVPSRAWKDSDYSINTYSFELGASIDENDLPELEELNSKFLKKPLTDFEENFNLIHGINEAFNQDETMRISNYYIVNKKEEKVINGLYLVSKNGTVESIKIDKPDIDFENLEAYFI